MILKTIRLLGKASTVAWAAKTGYDVYKVGNTAYKAYKKAKQIHSGAKSLTGIKDIGEGISSGLKGVKSVRRTNKK